MNDPANKTIHLLLVDDEDDFRQAASRALTRQGFVVAEAESGERALEIVRVTPPELVVLDLRMSGMDGITTLELLRKIKSDLPVIILTGRGRFEDAVAGVRLEVVDFVQKPVDMKDLADRIRRLLARHEAGPVREKTIDRLMVPVETYRRFYVDQTMQEIIAALTELVFKPVAAGETTRRARRAVLVFSRREEFLGVIRVEDVVRLMIPAFLRNSPYSSYFTGMFLAQTKMIGKQTAGDLIGNYLSIEVDAPLMEAVNLMVSNRLMNLPIMRGKELVGILRDEDVFKEISDSILAR